MRNETGSGKKAQSVRCLPYNHEDCVTAPEPKCKRRGGVVVVCACTLSSRESENWITGPW